MSVERIDFLLVVVHARTDQKAAKELNMELSPFRASLAQVVQDACKAVEPGREKYAHLLTPGGKKAILREHLNLLLKADATRQPA